MDDKLKRSDSKKQKARLDSFSKNLSSDPPKGQCTFPSGVKEKIGHGSITSRRSRVSCCSDYASNLTAEKICSPSKTWCCASTSQATAQKDASVDCGVLVKQNTLTAPIILRKERFASTSFTTTKKDQDPMEREVSPTSVGVSVRQRTLSINEKQTPVEKEVVPICRCTSTSIRQNIRTAFTQNVPTPQIESLISEAPIEQEVASVSVQENASSSTIKSRCSAEQSTVKNYFITVPTNIEDWNRKVFIPLPKREDQKPFSTASKKPTVPSTSKGTYNLLVTNNDQQFFPASKAQSAPPTPKQSLRALTVSKNERAENQLMSSPPKETKIEADKEKILCPKSLIVSTNEFKDFLAADKKQSASSVLKAQSSPLQQTSFPITTKTTNTQKSLCPKCLIVSTNEFKDFLSAEKKQSGSSVSKVSVPKEQTESLTSESSTTLGKNNWFSITITSKIDGKEENQNYSTSLYDYKSSPVFKKQNTSESLKGSSVSLPSKGKNVKSAQLKLETKKKLENFEESENNYYIAVRSKIDDKNESGSPKGPKTFPSLKKQNSFVSSSFSNMRSSLPSKERVKYPLEKYSPPKRQSNSAARKADKVSPKKKERKSKKLFDSDSYKTSSTEKRYPNGTASSSVMNKPISCKMEDKFYSITVPTNTEGTVELENKVHFPVKGKVSSISKKTKTPMASTTQNRSVSPLIMGKPIACEMEDKYYSITVPSNITDKGEKGEKIYSPEKRKLSPISKKTETPIRKGTKTPKSSTENDRSVSRSTKDKPILCEMEDKYYSIAVPSNITGKGEKIISPSKSDKPMSCEMEDKFYSITVPSNITDKGEKGEKIHYPEKRKPSPISKKPETSPIRKEPKSPTSSTGKDRNVSPSKSDKPMSCEMENKYYSITVPSNITEKGEKIISPSKSDKPMSCEMEDKYYSIAVPSNITDKGEKGEKIHYPEKRKPSPISKKPETSPIRKEPKSPTSSTGKDRNVSPSKSDKPMSCEMEDKYYSITVPSNITEKGEKIISPSKSDKPTSCEMEDKYYSITVPSNITDKGEKGEKIHYPEKRKLSPISKKPETSPIRKEPKSPTSSTGKDRNVSPSKSDKPMSCEMEDKYYSITVPSNITEKGEKIISPSKSDKPMSCEMEDKFYSITVPSNITDKGEKGEKIHYPEKRKPSPISKKPVATPIRKEPKSHRSSTGKVRNVSPSNSDKPMFYEMEDTFYSITVPSNITNKREKGGKIYYPEKRKPSPKSKNPEATPIRKVSKSPTSSPGKYRNVSPSNSDKPMFYEMEDTFYSITVPSNITNKGEKGGKIYYPEKRKPSPISKKSETSPIRKEPKSPTSSTGKDRNVSPSNSDNPMFYEMEDKYYSITVPSNITDKGGKIYYPEKRKPSPKSKNPEATPIRKESKSPSSPGKYRNVSPSNSDNPMFYEMEDKFYSITVPSNITDKGGKIYYPEKRKPSPTSKNPEATPIRKESKSPTSSPGKYRNISPSNSDNPMLYKMEDKFYSITVPSNITDKGEKGKKIHYSERRESPSILKKPYASSSRKGSITINHEAHKGRNMGSKKKEAHGGSKALRRLSPNLKESEDSFSSKEPQISQQTFLSFSSQPDDMSSRNLIVFPTDKVLTNAPNEKPKNISGSPLNERNDSVALKNQLKGVPRGSGIVVPSNLEADVNKKHADSLIMEKYYSKALPTNMENQPINQMNKTKLNTKGTKTEEGFIEEEEEEEGSDDSLRPKRAKFPFTFKRNNNGNILTVHHTIQEDDEQLRRIRLCVCGFNNKATLFVAIDSRGNVFVFDLVKRYYWRLSSFIHKASIIKASMYKKNQFLVGTCMGQLLVLDAVDCCVVSIVQICLNPITEISFPGQPLQPSELVLLRSGCEAIIMDLDTCTATHRLDFVDTNIELKFASYLPQSEQIFTCFNNDSVHVWSGVTLNTLQVLYPIKVRDRYLQLSGKAKVPEFVLEPSECVCDEFQFNCHEVDYSNGLIVAYCCQPDGTLFCLCTVDGYMLLLSPYTFQIERIIRLRDFVFLKCVFLPQPPKETLLLGLTSTGLVLLLDLRHTQYKLLVQLPSAAEDLTISLDGKLLSVLVNTGEAHIWATCRLFNTLRSQQQCMQVLQSSVKQHKRIGPACDNLAFNKEIKHLLEQDRLMAILVEYGSYPPKYRQLIWCTLLQLPYNKCEFHQLLKLNMPPIIRQQATTLHFKKASFKHALLKVWSCLAHWCKIFGYAPFIPHLIFPFIKFYSQNALVAFEVCATLLQNHFQLWFEFHPMVPHNYLGFCENLLRHYDLPLQNFFESKEITPTYYIWTLLMNSFSVVLNEEQWFCLWDHIISSPPYLPAFSAVAYNILQREVLLRLPTKQAVMQFYCEQNPIDISKLVAKSHKLMKECPRHLHPKRYMKDFEPIPKNVYPKFLNYPQQWITQQENEVACLQQENCAIDERIRKLETEENNILERLESGLKEEEHAKRMKELEKVYADTLKREQERMSKQRKTLLLYQKEIRNRKGEVYAALQEVERRKKELQLEKDLDALKNSIECERVRNETNILLAEDELRNHELELKAQKYFATSTTTPLAKKYSADLRRLREERNLMINDVQQLYTEPSVTTSTSRSCTNLDYIEQQFNDILNEFKCIMK